ncbi:RNA-directed DNA polymerase from transposon X, partial [Brachionus plicatilis]
MWNCSNNNPKGKILENALIEFNLHILNCPTFTYNRGKSVLDLSLCSNSMFKYFDQHIVLNDLISDHQPTLTTFNDLHSEPKKFTFKKINWQKFDKIISNSNNPINPISNTSDLDTELENLIHTINFSIESCTEKITFISKSLHPKPIPRPLLLEIKAKQRVQRLKKKYKSPLLVKLYNYLNNRVRKQISTLKTSSLINEFLDLKYFNQSDSKCWATLKKIGQDDSLQTQNQKNIVKLKDKNGININTNEEIANAFGDNLEKIFKCEVPTKISNQSFDLPKDIKSALITKIEFFEALKLIKPQAAPGFDKINNKTLKNLPYSILK